MFRPYFLRFSHVVNVGDPTGPQGLWLRLAELETKYGNAESLDNVPGSSVGRWEEEVNVNMVQHLGGIEVFNIFFGHISKICEICQGNMMFEKNIWVRWRGMWNKELNGTWNIYWYDIYYMHEFIFMSFQKIWLQRLGFATLCQLPLLRHEWGAAACSDLLPTCWDLVAHGTLECLSWAKVLLSLWGCIHTLLYTYISLMRIHWNITFCISCVCWYKNDTYNYIFY